MTTIQRIQDQIAKGSEASIIQILDKLESNVVLNPELQEKLDSIGDTPLLESKRNEAIDKQTENGLLPIIEDLITREEADKYSAEEIGDFIHKVVEKVTSFKKEDGTYKSTPNTKECDMPNAFEVDDIFKLIMEGNTLSDSAKDAPTNEKEKVLKKIIKISKDLQKMVFKTAGLDKSKLTDWEVSLVTEMTYSTVRGFRDHAAGKRFQI
jgi:hypothetical protein